MINLEPVPLGVWAQIERVWFAPTSPRLIERARESRWVPDTLSDYCPRCFASTSGPGPCRVCESHRPPWRRAVRLGEYVSPLDAWIRELKFTRFRAVGDQLGEWLGQAVAVALEHERAASALPHRAPFIIPIPTTFTRRWLRGIDHTRVLARGVSRVTGGHILQALRRAPRPSQRDIAPSNRAANVRRMFRLAIDLTLRIPADQPIVIVDDVTTTGATLDAAARTIARPFKDQTRPAILVAAVAWTPPWRRGRQDV